MEAILTLLGNIFAAIATALGMKKDKDKWGLKTRRTGFIEIKIFLLIKKDIVEGIWLLIPLTHV